MLSIALIFGLISGAISVLMMLLTMPFMDRLGFDFAEILGYTTLVGSFLLVFFGIRRYRELSGGTLTFGRGFLVGILITVVSSLCYVAAWEIISRRMAPDFMEKYQAHLMDKARAKGASQAELDAQAAEMERYKAMYANPFLKVAITFLEPFLVGLLLTVVSAVILRRKSLPPTRLAAQT